MVLRNSFCFVTMVFNDVVSVSDMTSILYLVISFKLSCSGYFVCIPSIGWVVVVVVVVVVVAVAVLVMVAPSVACRFQFVFLEAVLKSLV